MRLKVLVEGPSDLPTVRSILQRRFKLSEGIDFDVLPHQGKGRLPANPERAPDPSQRGLLHQLPAKLRGMSHLGSDACVVVLVDADDDDCADLLSQLKTMLSQLRKRPARVLFRIAIEETESWFIADREAVLSAYPRARIGQLKRLRADSVCGAWERLAQAVGSTNAKGQAVQRKIEWAEQISPHLDLRNPRSPSLGKFIAGIERELGRTPATPPAPD